MTEAEKTTALTLPERAAIALGTAKHEANLLALAKKHADIVEIKNPAGREQCHGAMMTLANARIAISKAGKEARDDATKFSKAVIEEEKRLISIIEPEEDRLRGLRDAWDAEREREKQAKAEAEKCRIAALQERIAEIRGAVAAAATCKPDLVLEHIGDIERMVIDASFEEFQGQAQLAKDETLDKLREIHAQAVAREEEAARMAAEREELDRLRREEAERQAQAAAARAEEERRLAAERETQEAQLRAEREAHERQLASERAEADRIAREKLAAEEAELRAQREAQEAEARRLAEARAQLEHQQREAEEQRKREEAQRAAAAQAADEQLRSAAHLLLAACKAALAEGPDMFCAAQLRAAIDAAEVVDAEMPKAA
ncbi:hypothetical protein R16034_00852 [Ralstonia edaphis]|uniref:Uncharacterized protein n=1 Tax=Ralstonia edaphi TaxID=3058599 RepID=A0AB72WXZ1_9RALS|nr:hypothetical protein [Ralstonia sp. LMG 6871]CAJ0737798.1 hypothetical protein R16034_00852 [Ralstonia sp. LMG 6871]